jgi:zinc/manganese transport system substrate-binding protein
MGDVHPEGNPHYIYSPIQMIRAGMAIRNCLQKIDKANFSYYEKNFSLLEIKLIKLSDRIKSALKMNKLLVLMTYHEEFLYLCRDFKLKCVGTIEDTPGVLPSASRLVKKVKFSKKNRVDLVLATDSNPLKILKKFKELSGVEFFQIEAHMNTKIKTYDEFIEQIVEVLNKNGK